MGADAAVVPGGVAGIGVDPVEIRFHGRGGQGTVTLAALATDAAVSSGWRAVGFPAFGPERTGAPVQAYLRLSRNEIRDRSEIRSPHVVVVQDPTLLESVDVTAGIAEGGLILLNAGSVPPALAEGPWTVVPLPATEIALRHLGTAHTSTAMLGFVAKATGWLDRDAVVAATLRRFEGPLGERNRDAALEAFAAAARQPTALVPSPASVGAPRSPEPLPARLTTGLVAAPGSSVAYRTGGWRTEVPRFLVERCTGCDLCAVFCPEGIVFRVGPHEYDFDRDFCKGCGICAVECPTDDIVMEAEVR